MSIAHPSNQSNYAVERSAAQTETPHAVWRRTLARMNTDEIAQLVVDMQTSFNGDLAIVGKALADAEKELEGWRETVDYWRQHHAELDRGCSWLAEELCDLEHDYNTEFRHTLNDRMRAEAAEAQLATIIGLSTCDGTILQNALRRLANEERNHDTTKRLLVQLQAEADDLRNRLTLVAETHVSDLAIMGDAYDVLSVAHTEAIDILGRVAHCLVEHIDIGPALTKQIMTIITKEATP